MIKKCKFQKIADLLWQKRIDKNMTQNELALILEASQSRISKIEANKITIDLIFWIKYIRTLGIKPEEILKVLREQ